MKRMFLGMLATETNTFSPVPTGPNVWKEMMLVRRSDPLDQDPPAVRVARALLERKHILVVKSTQHFHAGFAPISKQVLYAGDLGALPGDMTAIPLRRADTGRLWPLVEDPFTS